MDQTVNNFFKKPSAVDRDNMIKTLMNLPRHERRRIGKQYKVKIPGIPIILKKEKVK